MFAVVPSPPALRCRAHGVAHTASSKSRSSATSDKTRLIVELMFDFHLAALRCVHILYEARQSCRDIEPDGSGVSSHGQDTGAVLAKGFWVWRVRVI